MATTPFTVLPPHKRPPVDNITTQDKGIARVLLQKASNFFRLRPFRTEVNIRKNNCFVMLLFLRHIFIPKLLTQKKNCIIKKRLPKYEINVSTFTAQ